MFVQAVRTDTAPVHSTSRSERRQRDERYQHLLHRYSSVLKGVRIVGDVVIVVVGIDKVVLARGKDVLRTDVGRRQVQV